MMPVWLWPAVDTRLSTKHCCTHLMQQCIIQALHQVRVSNVTTQELALLNAEVLQSLGFQTPGCQLLSWINKVNIHTLATFLGTVPVEVTPETHKPNLLAWPLQPTGHGDSECSGQDSGCANY
eukprot:GHRR01037530.1.p1 GENE.GHRR01037530.1~~GHRR01037530.1.p1  ORF type:complete len:123 (+),score=19.41 GHRR01037530.1:188-556(+)